MGAPWAPRRRTSLSRTVVFWKILSGGLPSRSRTVSAMTRSSPVHAGLLGRIVPFISCHIRRDGPGCVREPVLPWGPDLLPSAARIFILRCSDWKILCGGLRFGAGKNEVSDAVRTAREKVLDSDYLELSHACQFFIFDCPFRQL